MRTMTEKTDIIDLSKKDLASWLQQRDLESYRSEQILKWIHARQADDFFVMSNLKKDLRQLLSEHFTINRLKRKKIEESKDGTRKILFELKDKNCVETVLIPGKKRYTLCISSQAGCAQGCEFCHTAKAGFKRNLSTSEIIGQARDVQNMASTSLPLTNVVIMGMGEPLANYQNVINALDIMTDPIAGLKFASRKVTLSTSGLAPKIHDLGRDTHMNLAVSLNAADNKTRSMLMPINRKHPLEELLKACRMYNLAPRRRITFEYILIKGVNDSEKDARRLAKLVSGIKSKINLIPFNVFPGTDFRRPAAATMDRFRETLVENNQTAITRQSKGEDISAACGQLNAYDRG